MVDPPELALQVRYLELFLTTVLIVIHHKALMRLVYCLRKIVQWNINDSGGWPCTLAENSHVKIYLHFLVHHDFLDNRGILFMKVVFIEKSLNSLGELDAAT